MTGSVERQLNSYIHQLNEAQKESLLGFIKTIFPGREEEGVISVAQYNRELDEANVAMERGEAYTNEEVFNMSKQLIDARKKGSLVKAR